MADIRKLYAAIVFLAILISGMCIDIYSPSLPAVTAYYHVDKSLVQLTIATYVFGYAIAQLFAGSHSDSVGRKLPLVVATGLFTVISFLIPYSETIYQLQGLRFLQGVAVAYINVPIRAVVADLFEGEEFYKEMNYVTMAWSMGPIIAPALGGYLQHYIGWQASFYFLAAYGGLIFILCAFILPETIKQKHHFSPHQLLSNYWHILTNRDYFLGVVVMGLLYALLILFGVVAPFLIQDILGYSAVEFGHMALVMGFAWFLGNLTNRILHKLNMASKVRFALTVMSVTSLVMLLVAMKESIWIYDIIPPLCVIFFFGGIIYPIHFAHCVAIFRELAASAGALLGTVVVFLAGLGSVLGVFLKSHTQIPLTLTYLIICIICLICSCLMTYRMKN